jgi:hypothetical protein
MPEAAPEEKAAKARKVTAEPKLNRSTPTPKC